ncbi:hypothetical protein BH09BAC2_BH09BAC2_23800 [soil metagenome]
MKVKIDTKEKFHVITPEETVLNAKMTEALKNICLPYLESDNKNVVLNMINVDQLDNEAADAVSELQSKFYEKNASLVICELKQGVEDFLDNKELLEVMNVTPSESEAWDIVQMEEIEREYLDNEDL